MKIRDLEYLVAATAEGNFSRAATSLGINPSTVSRRIGRLEDELGLSLFERHRAGVRLTAGGRNVLAHVRRAVAEIEAIRCAGQQTGTGAVGEVRLGVRIPPIGKAMHELLSAWRLNCPDVRLTIAEMNERDLAIALDQRRLDVALVPSQTLPPRIASLTICREPLFAALPRDHSLVRRKMLTWPALKRELLLVQRWDDSQAEREFLIAILGTGPNFRYHGASKQAILALVGAGFGITVVTESQAAVRCPGVLFRPIGEPNAYLQLDLAWMPETEEPAVGRFVAFMRDEARSRGFF